MTPKLPFYPHDALPPGVVSMTYLRRCTPPRVLVEGARPVALTRYPGAKTDSHLYDFAETVPVDV